MLTIKFWKAICLHKVLSVNNCSHLLAFAIHSVASVWITTSNADQALCIVHMLGSSCISVFGENNLIMGAMLMHDGEGLFTICSIINVHT